MSTAIITRSAATARTLRLLCLALLLGGLYSAAAMAQARDCTLTLAPLSFGNYDPLETTVPFDSTTTMNVTCRRNTRVDISFSAGSSGTFAQRTMRQGTTSLLAYNLYQEAARVTILGDNTGGSVPLRLRVRRRGANITLYGRIPPGQDPSIGLHSDTIIVTMTF